MALEPSERLFAGVVLIVIGLVGLVYRLTGYGMIIGDIRTGSMFYSGGYSPPVPGYQCGFYNRGIAGGYISYMTRFEKTQDPELI
ncbi:MAG: hypothetical protein O8C62_02265 [Candidatus Methanoperedens sp.]|nr:hypothetical protein [Candidatus Methanoperedens sp.]